MEVSNLYRKGLIKTKKKPRIFWVDLFSGAGGTTTGIYMGNTRAKVVACVNHDANAIASHLANHPETKHFTEDIRDFKVVQEIKKITDELRAKYPNCFIKIWASLECTNFSNAKGGLPKDADSRTLAEHLFMYLDALNPDYLYIENVREFRSWGALDANGKPVSKDKGNAYLKWVANIEALGYSYDYRDLNSADFKAYTSRTRYFGIFAKEGLPIEFPEPEITKKAKRKPVREVLDLDNVGANLFCKKRSDNTIARIHKGLEKALGEPYFLTSYYGNGKSHSIDEPCNTLTTKDRYAFHYVHYDYSSLTTSSIDAPVGSFTTVPKHNLVSAIWLTDFQFGRTHKSIKEPCMTIIARQDKKPIYFLQAEEGELANRISSTDSDEVKALKQFMIDKGVRAVYIRMLTLEEMLLIQGFPKDYVLIGTKANKTKQIGNSVPPVLARKLAEAGERALTEYLN